MRQLLAIAAVPQANVGRGQRASYVEARGHRQVRRAVTASSPRRRGPASRRAEAFDPDATGFMAEGHKTACRGLHEPGRATDVHQRVLVWRPGDVVEQFLVDPSPVS